MKPTFIQWKRSKRIKELTLFTGIFFMTESSRCLSEILGLLKKKKKKILAAGWKLPDDSVSYKHWWAQAQGLKRCFKMAIDRWKITMKPHNKATKWQKNTLRDKQYNYKDKNDQLQVTKTLGPRTQRAGVTLEPIFLSQSWFFACWSVWTSPQN